MVQKTIYLPQSVSLELKEYEGELKDSISNICREAIKQAIAEVKQDKHRNN